MIISPNRPTQNITHYNFSSSRMLDLSGNNNFLFDIGSDDSDVVVISENKPESFKKIWEEMGKNVPDQTSTVEEKELALSYIKRILNSDAPTETKNYWKNKQLIIQNEIKAIQSSQSGKPESFEKVWEEMSKNVPDSTSTVEEKELALSYIGRILNSDASPEIKNYWQNKYLVIQNEMRSIQSSQSGKPESFDQVWDEFIKNVPDSTTTVEEKELALSYIKRILNSDAPTETKNYWQNQYFEIMSEMIGLQQSKNQNPFSH